jgi:hypothetical protein
MVKRNKYKPICKRVTLMTILELCRIAEVNHEIKVVTAMAEIM